MKNYKIVNGKNEVIESGLMYKEALDVIHELRSDQQSLYDEFCAESEGDCEYTRETFKVVEM